MLSPRAQSFGLSIFFAHRTYQPFKQNPPILIVPEIEPELENSTRIQRSIYMYYGAKT